MIEILSRPEVQQFIRDHENHDPFQLILQAKKYPDLPIKAIAAQIRARQKAKTKLPAWYHTPGIIFPSILALEQCSSEATARYKSSLIAGKRLVDLTGGAGVDTYYMSRHFDQTDYIEQNETLTAVTRHNFQILQAHNMHVHTTQAETFLQNLSQQVDCIYVDPARRGDQAQKVYKLEDCTPNVIDLKGLLIAKATSVLIKTSPMLDIEAAVHALQYVAKVFVVALHNECKEVLYLLNPEACQDPEITAVNLQHADRQILSFTKNAETTAEVAYSQPLRYLYEPNAAILKAGAFKSVAKLYGVFKLHPHTHLYTSDQLIPDFPGRIFSCEAVTAYNKRDVRAYLPGGKANISTRNFPNTVQEARKKLGLADGGEYYLFLSVIAGKPRVMITTKVPGRI